MPPGRNLIIYDGECIYCQNYVKFLRLRETIGPVELLDARSDDPRVAQYWREGYDLNDGMVFVQGETVHHGARAVHVLASLSSDSSRLNRLNAAIFSSEPVARLLYPVMKLGRRLTLMARGRKMMERP